MSSADPVPPTTSPAGFLEASWSPEALAERGGRGAVKSLWRVLATTWHGIIAHRLPQQSAALTYYTLMSLGPLLGLALTVSGFILSRGAPEDNPAKRAIVAAVEYAAPQIVAKASTPDHHATLREINKDLDALVDRLLQTAASGEAGVIGLLLILGLAVLMLSRVEDALNGIWGVRFGRSWRDRFANYLLFLVLFFLVGATTLTMLSAASLAASLGAGATWLSSWFHKLPGGEQITGFFSGGGPLFISLTLLTLAFAAFNRMMPNARVRWSAALVGGLAIAVLVISVGAVAAIRHSRFGRALVAIREDEILAASLGIAVTRHKLAAYVLTSMLAALAGSVYAPFAGFISPDLMSAGESVALVGVLIVGGIGTLSGPLIGTLIFFAIPELLRIAKFYRLVILGAVIVASVLFMPEGIVGFFSKHWRALRRRAKGG